jgi:hypothetical protein
MLFRGGMHSVPCVANFQLDGDIICDEWTFIIVEQLTGMRQNNSRRLARCVRKPPIDRVFRVTLSRVLEPVAHKTAENLALAQSAVSVMNRLPLCNITLSLDNSIGS